MSAIDKMYQTYTAVTVTPRPGGEQMHILEQVFHDHMLSLTFQIQKADERKSGYAFFIRILGAIPLGNRTWYFDKYGKMVQAHTDHDVNRVSKGFKSDTGK